MKTGRHRIPARPRPASARKIRITVSGCGGATAAMLRRAARHTLLRERKQNASVEIAVIGDQAMRAAHYRWKHSLAATDVLSFDLSDDAGRIEGILLVCGETAQRESRRRGIPVVSELALYVVHGALHLAGYDDRRPRDFKRMHEREDELLEELGIGRVFASP